MKSSTKKTFRYEMRLDAPPARIFPLLCPVREYDWIEHWKCEIIYSVSGVAEEGCIFRTEFPGDDRMTWVVTSYEPPRRIGFTCFVPDCRVMRLTIDLTPQGSGSLLRWVREFTAIDEEGKTWVDGYGESRHRAMMDLLRSSLEHYLNTGSMLRQAGPPVQSSE